MITISTNEGKRIEIVLESELRSPVDMGEHVRAYCHIHGSDHQRSLSINKATGWGHCFNAVCEATVLVVEWNRPLAKRLIHWHYQGLTAPAQPSYQQPAPETIQKPSVIQPMLLPPPKAIPQWQRDELAVLCELDKRMRLALSRSPRARMYLHARGIPLRTALETGVGYLPPTLLKELETHEQQELVRRWVDRILFPLNSPDGRGYIGRSLWRWQPGINETLHKALLERPGSPKRWIKTNPAGWFSEDFADFPPTIILVEGAFDRLTLLAAGFQSSEVVALVGTAAPINWLLSQVQTVVLALDGDDGGREASQRLAEQLTRAGLQIRICPLLQDTRGKDWNERWQRMGRRSMAPVFKAFAEARSA